MEMTLFLAVEFTPEWRLVCVSLKGRATHFNKRSLEDNTAGWDALPKDVKFSLIWIQSALP